MSTLDKRLDALEARMPPPPGPAPEWMLWSTGTELMRIDQMLRDAGVATVGELGEADQHRVMAIYSAAMARMADASPEVRADPAARDAYVREGRG